MTPMKPSVMHRPAILCGALLALPAFAATPPGHPPRDSLRITHVQGNVHQLSGAGGNITLQTGDEGVLVVNTGDGTQDAAVLAAIREFAARRPILYVVNTQATPWNVGGNPSVRAAGTTFTGGNANVRGVSNVGAGATVVSHENALLAMSAAQPDVRGLASYGEGYWPGQTFYTDKLDLFVNGEPIELIHVPNAITDGDLIVHFRRSDVISTGDLFSFTGYPLIDRAKGGSLEGTIRALERVMDIAIVANWEEGGTMIVAGHGRIADQSEVVQYRNMLVFIRDQIRDMIDSGLSLAEIRRARPLLDFDARYSRPGWTGDDFIDLVHAELTQRE